MINRVFRITYSTEKLAFKYFFFSVIAILRTLSQSDNNNNNNNNNNWMWKRNSYNKWNEGNWSTMDTSLGRRTIWRRTWLKDAHQDTEQGVVKEDVGEKISASGRGYTSTWQQDLQRTENSERTLCMPPTLLLEDGTRQRLRIIIRKFVTYTYSVVALNRRRRLSPKLHLADLSKTKTCLRQIWTNQCLHLSPRDMS